MKTFSYNSNFVKQITFSQILTPAKFPLDYHLFESNFTFLINNMLQTLIHNFSYFKNRELTANHWIWFWHRAETTFWIYCKHGWYSPRWCCFLNKNILSYNTTSSFCFWQPAANGSYNQPQKWPTAHDLPHSCNHPDQPLSTSLPWFD